MPLGALGVGGRYYISGSGSLEFAWLLAAFDVQFGGKH